jgi:hypothetical protein
MSLIKPERAASLAFIRPRSPLSLTSRAAPSVRRATPGSSPGDPQASRRRYPPPSSAQRRRSQRVRSSDGALARRTGSGASADSVPRRCRRHPGRPGRAEPGGPPVPAPTRARRRHPPRGHSPRARRARTRVPPTLRLPGYGPHAAHAETPGVRSAGPGIHVAVAWLGLRGEARPALLPATRDHRAARSRPHSNAEPVGLLATTCVWLKSSLHGSPLKSPAGTGRSRRTLSQRAGRPSVQLPTLTPSSRSVGTAREELRALVGRRASCI